MKPSHLRNIASLFYFTGTFILVAVIALSYTSVASAKPSNSAVYLTTDTFTTTTSSSSSSSSSSSFSSSSSSSSSGGSSTSSNGSPAPSQNTRGRRVGIGGLLHFPCDFPEIKAKSITWYFGDGTSLTCPKNEKGHFYGSLTHSYSPAGSYYAYALTDTGDKVYFLNVKVSTESSLGLIGFILIALGFSTHFISHKLKAKV